MPRRKQLIINDEVYHVFNKSIDKKPAFVTKRECDRAVEVIGYYKLQNPPVRYSRYRRMKIADRKDILSKIRNRKLVEIFSFCLMPNHFHFLVKQKIDGGISRFIGNFLNSYTRYYNTRRERVGPLFLDQFKAVRIESDEQLLHVSRYIHLNPYTSYVVGKILDLDKYIWSSFVEYLGLVKRDTCKKDVILSYFKNVGNYKAFVYNHADYQKELKRIEHLVIE